MRKERAEERGRRGKDEGSKRERSKWKKKDEYGRGEGTVEEGSGRRNKRRRRRGIECE